MDVCLVGAAPSLMWALPSLLARSGFVVDVLATSNLLRASRFVRSFEWVDTLEQLIELAYLRICNRERPYDWVIACDDETLLHLSRLAWSAGYEPKYLSRAGAGAVSHIYSKIGLGRVLVAAGVRTPAFRLAADCADAVAAARELGYPVLIKTDAASSGTGVRECRTDSDVWKLEVLFGYEPLLVQKKIEGRELDLSAIYFERNLVHFTYSSVVRTRSTFGVSNIRIYHPLPLVQEDVFDELAKLGQALDANGFASISCIEAADNSGRYYFEADMRPNAWSDISRHYGEDAAPRIRNWFLTGETLRKTNLGPDPKCAPVTVPYFMRIARWELLLNRYGAWRFIPWDDLWVVLWMLCSRAIMPVARTVVPSTLRRVVRHGMIGVGVPFP